MKKTFLSVLLIAFVLVSCNQKSKEEATENSNMMGNDTTTTASDTAKTDHQVADSKLYACPMHPEVQGKSDEKCSKCGMKLTEPVK